MVAAGMQGFLVLCCILFLFYKQDFDIVHPFIQSKHPLLLNIQLER